MALPEFAENLCFQCAFSVTVHIIYSTHNKNTDKYRKAKTIIHKREEISMMKKLTATVFAGIAAMMLTITAFTGPAAGKCSSSMPQAIGNVQMENTVYVLARGKC